MINNSFPKRSKAIVLGLYGAGGFAREVMPFALMHPSIIKQATAESSQQIYFVESMPQQKEVNGIPLISEEDFFRLECSERLFNIAIGDSKVRERIANECISKGAKPLS